MEEDKKIKKDGEKPQEKKPVKKGNDDFKRKYFEYYDDVKTNIKEDW